MESGREQEGAGNLSVCLQVTGGEGVGGQLGLGKTTVRLGRGEGCAKRSRFCGCVISLLQAGNTAAEPHLTSTQGLSSGHHSQL